MAPPSGLTGEALSPEKKGRDPPVYQEASPKLHLSAPICQVDWVSSCKGAWKASTYIAFFSIYRKQQALPERTRGWRMARGGQPTIFSSSWNTLGRKGPPS